MASGVCVHKPLAAVSLSMSDNLLKEYNGELSMYSPYWVMFPPNLVVDTNVGLFATVTLCAEDAENFIKDKVSF